MDRIATLLAQFPGPVTLAVSRWKWWGFVTASAVFTAAGIAEATHSSSGALGDWLGVAFFGVLTVVGAVGISIGRFDVTLDADAFTCRIARKAERWRWEDVDDFAVVEYAAGTPGASLRKRIGFNDKRPVKTTSQRLGEGLTKAMTQRDCFLLDTSGSTSFGLPMEDLARLMSQWQERALAARRAAGAKP
jgi:hypothetical protein